jgi:hypothetical protein
MITSKLKALTRPHEWELLPVTVVFGTVRPTRAEVIHSGDLVQDKEGLVKRFLFREGSRLELEDVDLSVIP